MPVRVLGLLLMLIGVLLIFASTRRSGDQRVVALEKRYDHSGIGSSTRIWTTYDSLVVAHGVMMFVAWQILAPLAIMIASMCRTWSRHWFRAHWMIQAFITVPLTIAGIVIGTIMHTSSQKPITKHKILGIAIFALMLLQAVIGVATRAERTQKAISGKRSMLAWTHIIIGLVLMTISGLNVTWGFNEYTNWPIPTWIRIAHYVIAGVPLLILGPFVLVRGFLRMRRGTTFVEAFFDRPETVVAHPSPRSRTLFDWQGSSGYIEQRASELRRPVEEGEGYAYDGSSTRSLLRPRASVNSYTSTMTWEGASTREEYEISLLERSKQQPVVDTYDYPEAVFGETTPGSLYQQPVPSAPPPLPPYPAELERTVTQSTTTESLESAPPVSSPGTPVPTSYTEAEPLHSSTSPPILPPIPPSFANSHTSRNDPIIDLDRSTNLPSSADNLISPSPLTTTSSSPNTGGIVPWSSSSSTTSRSSVAIVRPITKDDDDDDDDQETPLDHHLIPRPTLITIESRQSRGVECHHHHQQQPGSSPSTTDLNRAISMSATVLYHHDHDDDGEAGSEVDQMGSSTGQMSLEVVDERPEVKEADLSTSRGTRSGIETNLHVNDEDDEADQETRVGDTAQQEKREGVTGDGHESETESLLSRVASGRWLGSSAQN